MNKKEYNGWTNYETWNCALWLNNDSGSYYYWTEQAEEAVKNAIESGPRYDFMSVRDEAATSLADMLKTEIEEGIPQEMENASMYADMLNAALSEIDYREIADHYIGEIKIYSAMWNMPGCMPESEPAFFTDEDEAKEYLCDEIRNHADSDESITEDEIYELCEAIEHGESVSYAGYVYNYSEV